MLTGETGETRHLKLAELYTLQEAGIAGGELTMRKLSKRYLASLGASDASAWPPIIVTKSVREDPDGYAIVDGLHRLEAARRKGLKELKATIRAYGSDNEIVEAAFRANLVHGLPASSQTRSDYAYWLYKTYPGIGQRTIADRVGVRPSTVSIAIKRRLAKDPTKQDPVRKRRHLKQSIQSFTRSTTKLYDEIEDLDEQDAASLLDVVVSTNEQRAKLRHIAKLVDQSLAPQKSDGPLAHSPENSRK